MFDLIEDVCIHKKVTSMCVLEIILSYGTVIYQCKWKKEVYSYWTKEQYEEPRNCALKISLQLVKFHFIVSQL